MDFGDPKEIVRYTDQTLLRNIGSLAELARFRPKGFRVSYDEIDGAKIATEIAVLGSATAMRDPGFGIRRWWCRVT